MAFRPTLINGLAFSGWVGIKGPLFHLQEKVDHSSQTQLLSRVSLFQPQSSMRVNIPLLLQGRIGCQEIFGLVRPRLVFLPAFGPVDLLGK